MVVGVVVVVVVVVVGAGPFFHPSRSEKDALIVTMASVGSGSRAWAAAAVRVIRARISDRGLCGAAAKRAAFLGDCRGEVIAPGRARRLVMMATITAFA